MPGLKYKPFKEFNDLSKKDLQKLLEKAADTTRTEIEQQRLKKAQDAIAKKHKTLEQRIARSLKAFHTPQKNPKNHPKNMAAYLKDFEKAFDSIPHNLLV